MPSRLVASESLLQAIFAHTNRLSWQQRQYILRFLGGYDDKPPSELIGLESSSSSSSSSDDSTAAVRQVLLHEETRTETSTSSTSTSTSSSSSSSSRVYNIVDQIVFEMDYSTGCWRKLRRRIRMVNKDGERERGGERVSNRRSRRGRDRRLDFTTTTTTTASASADASSFFTLVNNIDDIPTDGRPSLRPRQYHHHHDHHHHQQQQQQQEDVNNNLRQQQQQQQSPESTTSASNNEFTLWHRSNRGSSSSSGCGR
ncbi:hypothetical protein MP638_002629 [Amoeboaphelidium occidentale]|nr:hypothetical protein MP638_002629 [Amoeboaphelidium occidentale]